MGVRVLGAPAGASQEDRTDMRPGVAGRQEDVSPTATTETVPRSDQAPPPCEEAQADEAAPPDPLAVSEAVLVTEDSPEYWVCRINEHVKAGVQALVQAGRDLRAAKAQLEHGQFQSMFEPGKLRISQRTAEMFMQIAGHPVLSDPNNYSVLPPTLNALTTLSRLSEAKLQQALSEGHVNPQMTISDARALIAGSTEAKAEAPRPESALCDKRLKDIGRFLAEAKLWPVEQRRRFVDELRQLLDGMVQ